MKLVEAVTAMNFYWAIYTIEKAPNVPIFFLMGILNNEGLLDLNNLNLNTHEGEEMAFIEQRSRGALQWRQFWLIIGVNKIRNKIHCAASKVDETWWKYSFTMDYHVEVQHLGEPPETRP